MKIKKCKKCGKIRDHNNPLLSLCKACYYEKQLNNKNQYKIHIISKKKKERLKNGGGEKELFAEIWKERLHICNNCGKTLPKPRNWNFSHIKSKGARPDLRLDKNNIELLCFACHFEKDHGLKYKGPNLDI